MVVSNQKNGFTLNAYQGDAKTLLAWNMPKNITQKLAGFSIQCQPKGKSSYYLFNTLTFGKPAQHAQVTGELPHSSVNAPFQKFRWLHVPGSFHQGTDPVYGNYTYTVTPRYFGDKENLLPLDPKLSVAVTLAVTPFVKGGLQLGFTRGFIQSQGYVNHFGPKAVIEPDEHDLLYDTSKPAGKNKKGESFTWADEYDWLGFTARKRIFEVLDNVLKNNKLTIDVFAYDLSEPDICARFLTLAKQGRIRIILDNASLHLFDPAKKNTKGYPKAPTSEDNFEQAFLAQAKDRTAIKRGRFARFAHDKVIIVKEDNIPVRVLAGSTNFSITGLYVNSNHILIFNDAKVAQSYGDVFNKSWDLNVSATFKNTPLATKPASFDSKSTPNTEITFSPHTTAGATKIINQVSARVKAESGRANSSVLFAVMGLSSGGGTVLPVLRDLHNDQKTFSYGISDAPGGICLYSPGNSRGVMVTGKPSKEKLPPPFNQVPSVGSRHQIHHKFIVCGFNRPDATVICGSSNLTTGGEGANGDNLITITDTDVATAFAIEAVALVDHFEFLDRFAEAPKADKVKPSADKQKMAADAGWNLKTTDIWSTSFYDPNDLHSKDRTLFCA